MSGLNSPVEYGDDRFLPDDLGDFYDMDCEFEPDEPDCD